MKSKSGHVQQRTERKSDNAEQSKRFIETAEQVGADDEDALEHALKKIRERESKAHSPKK